MNRMKKMLCALLTMVMVVGVCVIPAEARSDNDQVQAFQALIDNAENGETVTLTENLLWADGEPVEVPSGKNITIDLNGYKMESLEPYPIFRVMSGAEVTIKSSIDTSIAKNKGMPEEFQEYYDAETMGLFEVQENAKLTIQSGEYEAGDNYFTGNTKGEVLLEGGFYNKVPEGTYTVKKGFEFVSANRNGVDVWTLSEAAPDITPPVIESIVFEQDGKTINRNDQISFILKGYDVDSEITSADILLSGDRIGCGIMGVATPVEGEVNTYKITGDAYSAGVFNRIYIEIIDAAGNFASYDIDNISLTVVKEEIFADVKGEISFSTQEIILDENDACEFELLGNYREQYEVRVTLDGDYSDVYSHAQIFHGYETTGGGEYCWLNLDEDASNKEKTVYKAGLYVTEINESENFIFKDVTLIQSADGKEASTTIEAKKIKFQKMFDDTEAPQIVRVSIDKQGQVANDGNVKITIEVKDNAELKFSVHSHMTLDAALYDISTEESHYACELKYEGNGIYTTVVNVNDLYPTEWYISYLSITDTVGNNITEYYTMSGPYYFYVSRNGECKKTVYKDVQINLFDNDGKVLTTFTQDIEHRCTLAELLGERMTVGSKTDDGVFKGWSTSLNGATVDGDKPFLADEWSVYCVNLYEVYENTAESEPTPEPDSNVTIVEDQKTEEAVKQETQKVVADIVAGTISNSVVDEQTAEKVAEAINSNKDVTAEIVVKEIKQEEIAQNDKAVIEEKVTAELGEDAKVQYLDVAIVLKADDEELGTLNKLEEEITITVAIPEELKAEGRIYKVIRNHNGEVTVLDTVVNADGTISFKTDRFSTYALAYADEEETNTNPNPGTPSTDNNKPSTDDNKDTNTNTNNNTNQGNKPATDKDAPKTGDNNSVMIYVAICLVALAAILVTKRRKAFVK